jgi:hypothetical protein
MGGGVCTVTKGGRDTNVCVRCDLSVWVWHAQPTLILCSMCIRDAGWCVYIWMREWGERGLCVCVCGGGDMDTCIWEKARKSQFLVSSDCLFYRGYLIHSLSAPTPSPSPLCSVYRFDCKVTPFFCQRVQRARVYVGHLCIAFIDLIRLFSKGQIGRTHRLVY